MYTLHTRFCTFGTNLYAQLMLINKISALELSPKLIKSALLAGWVPAPPEAAAGAMHKSFWLAPPEKFSLSFIQVLSETGIQNKEDRKILPNILYYYVGTIFGKLDTEGQLSSRGRRKSSAKCNIFCVLTQ